MPIPTQDFQPPFDPTQYSSISGAQLLQYITGTTPFTDTGIFLVTTDVTGNPTVPNATVTTKWQNYGWIRVSATLVTLYLWNPNAAVDATYLQWQSLNVIGIGAGSIVNSMIADNTIQSVKIVSLDYSKLTGAPTGLPPSGNAGGDLTGTYPSPSIAALAVTSGKIAAATILGSNISAKTVAASNILSSGAAQQLLRVQTADATIVEWFQPSKIVDPANLVVTTGNALKIPQVATAGADDTGTWQMQTIPQLLAQGRFTSTIVNLVAGTQLINAAHSLGGVPWGVKGIIVCISTELGYSVGDELDASQVYGYLGSGTNIGPGIITIGASATNVFAAQNSYTTGYTLHKTTGVLTQITFAKWNFKIYANI